METFEFSTQSVDGVPLYGQGWRPDGEIHAAICLVHGLGEHSGRYVHVGAALAAAGYALLAFDLRGHGRSGGQRGHAPNFDCVMDDLTTLLDEAGGRFPDQPRFLYGHSLGGNLVINYGLRRQPDLAGVIVSSPVLLAGFPVPAWKTSLGKLLYRLHPTFSLPNGLPLDGLSHDPRVVDAYRRDPLVHDRVSARFGLDVIAAGEWAYRSAGDFPLPILILQGEADPMASVAVNRRFAEQAPRATFKSWPGLYHELHNELEKDTVLAEMTAWLDAQLANGAAPADDPA